MQTEKQAIWAESRPERMVWYRDLLQEMTGHVPQVEATTVLRLIDGQYWHVRQVRAVVPAFVSATEVVYAPACVYGDTEEEALRELCEQVHALLWHEQEQQALLVWEPEAAVLVGAC